MTNTCEKTVKPHYVPPAPAPTVLPVAVVGCARAPASNSHAAALAVCHRRLHHCEDTPQLHRCRGARHKHLLSAGISAILKVAVSCVNSRVLEIEVSCQKKGRITNLIDIHNVTLPCSRIYRNIFSKISRNMPEASTTVRRGRDYWHLKASSCGILQK